MKMLESKYSASTKRFIATGLTLSVLMPTLFQSVAARASGPGSKPKPKPSNGTWSYDGVSVTGYTLDSSGEDWADTHQTSSIGVSVWANYSQAVDTEGSSVDVSAAYQAVYRWHASPSNTDFSKVDTLIYQLKENASGGASVDPNATAATSSASSSGAKASGSTKPPTYSYNVSKTTKGSRTGSWENPTAPPGTAVPSHIWYIDEAVTASASAAPGTAKNPPPGQESGVCDSGANGSISGTFSVAK